MIKLTIVKLLNYGAIAAAYTDLTTSSLIDYFRAYKPAAHVP